MEIPLVYLPPRIPVTNEGLLQDSLNKHVRPHPVGDGHPGWGVDPRNPLFPGATNHVYENSTGRPG